MKILLLVALSTLTGCAQHSGQKAYDNTYYSCINSGHDDFTCQQYAQQSYNQAARRVQAAWLGGLRGLQRN